MYLLAFIVFYVTWSILRAYDTVLNHNISERVQVGVGRDIAEIAMRAGAMVLLVYQGRHDDIYS